MHVYIYVEHIHIICMYTCTHALTLWYHQMQLIELTRLTDAEELLMTSDQAEVHVSCLLTVLFSLFL